MDISSNDQGETPNLYPNPPATELINITENVPAPDADSPHLTAPASFSPMLSPQGRRFSLSGGVRVEIEADSDDDNEVEKEEALYGEDKAEGNEADALHENGSGVADIREHIDELGVISDKNFTSIQDAPDVIIEVKQDNPLTGTTEAQKSNTTENSKVEEMLAGVGVVEYENISSSLSDQYIGKTNRKLHRGEVDAAIKIQSRARGMLDRAAIGPILDEIYPKVLLIQSIARGYLIRRRKKRTAHEKQEVNAIKLQRFLRKKLHYFKTTYEPNHSGHTTIYEILNSISKYDYEMDNGGENEDGASRKQSRVSKIDEEVGGDGNDGDESDSSPLITPEFTSKNEAQSNRTITNGESTPKRSSFVLSYLFGSKLFNTIGDEDEKDSSTEKVVDLKCDAARKIQMLFKRSKLLERIQRRFRIRCDDCGVQKAEKYCTTCEEAFCSRCWHIIHGHGNRKLHEYTAVGDSRLLYPVNVTLQSVESLNNMPNDVFKSPNENLPGRHNIAFSRCMSDSRIFISPTTPSVPTRSSNTTMPFGSMLYSDAKRLELANTSPPFLLSDIWSPKSAVDFANLAIKRDYERKVGRRLESLEPEFAPIPPLVSEVAINLSAKLSSFANASIHQDYWSRMGKRRKKNTSRRTKKKMPSSLMSKENELIAKTRKVGSNMYRAIDSEGSCEEISADSAMSFSPTGGEEAIEHDSPDALTKIRVPLYSGGGAKLNNNSNQTEKFVPRKFASTAATYSPVPAASDSDDGSVLASEGEPSVVKSSRNLNRSVTIDAIGNLEFPSFVSPRNLKQLPTSEQDILDENIHTNGDNDENTDTADDAGKPYTDDLGKQNNDDPSRSPSKALRYPTQTAAAHRTPEVLQKAREDEEENLLLQESILVGLETKLDGMKKQLGDAVVARDFIAAGTIQRDILQNTYDLALQSNKVNKSPLKIMKKVNSQMVGYGMQIKAADAPELDGNLDEGVHDSTETRIPDSDDEEILDSSVGPIEEDADAKFPKEKEIVSFETISKKRRENENPDEVDNDTFDEDEFTLVFDDVYWYIEWYHYLYRMYVQYKDFYVITKGIIYGGKHVVHAFFLFFVFIYIFSVFAIDLFGDNDPWHFQNLELSMMTMLSLATLDGWGEVFYIAYYGCDRYSGSRLLNDPSSVYLQKLTEERKFGVYGGQKICSDPQAQPVLAVFFFTGFIIMVSYYCMFTFAVIMYKSMGHAVKELEREEHYNAITDFTEKKCDHLRMQMKDQNYGRKTANALLTLRLVSHGASLVNKMQSEDPFLRRLYNKASLHFPNTDIQETPYAFSYYHLKISNALYRLSSSLAFELSVTLVIVLSAVMIGMQADHHIMSVETVHHIEKVIQAMFTVEVICVMFSEPSPYHYFKHPWNLFDLTVVLGAYIQMGEYPNAKVNYFQLFRILKIFKVLDQIKPLHILLDCIYNCLDGLFIITFIVLIAIGIMSNIGVGFFGKFDPFYFRDSDASYISLFQVMTRDGWIRLMQRNAFGCEVLDYPDALACGSQAEDYGHIGYFALSFLYFLACLIIFNFILFNSYIGLVIHKLHDHLARQLYMKKMQERIDHIKKNSYMSSQEIDKLHFAFNFLTHRQDICVGPVSLSFALEQGGYALSKTQFDSIWISYARLHKDRMDFSEFLEMYLDLREFAGNDRTTVKEQMNMFPASIGAGRLSETKEGNDLLGQNLDAGVLSRTQVPPSALEWWYQMLAGNNVTDTPEEVDVEDEDIDGRIGYNEEEDIANNSRKRKKVVTYMVLASDGINPKCIPHRKTPTLSVYGKGSFLTVRLKETMPNDIGVNQLWLLTNYGWITDRVIGSKDKKTLTMLIHNEQPLSIGVLGYELISLEGESEHVNINDDEYVETYEGETEIKGKRRPSMKSGAIKEVRYCIEIEIPTRDMAPYSDYIKTGVNKRQRQILAETYDEMTVMRIHRTFRRLQSLDNELDIHESYLGVKFPESFDDIENASSLIDLWLKAIIRTQQITETPSLSEFFKPSEEDVALMEIALEKEGGLDGTWKDVLYALDVNRQHVAGTVG